MTKPDPLKDEHSHAIANAKGWLDSIVDMVLRLNAAIEMRDAEGAECDEKLVEDIEREISESILSIEVRTGWYLPGSIESAAPEEYRLLLTWGGPALQLVGKLDEYNQPDDWPRLEYQDWGVPWTEYEPAREHREALQTFARQFYYGD